MRFNEQGFSTLLIILLFGLVGGIAMMVSQKTLSHLKVSKHLELRDEIQSLRRIFTSKLNCQATLNSSSTTAVPLSCNAYSNVIPKTAGATPIAVGGKIGAWTIRARCKGNSIVVGAIRDGKDPITGVDLSTKSYADDIFDGQSKFCQEYFAPGTSCTQAPYTLYRGSDSAGIRCCRLATTTNQNMSGARIAIAACAKNEYLAGGYSSCQPSDTGMTAIAVANYPSRYQDTFGIGVASGNFKVNRRSWTTDCFNAMGSNPTDSWSQATAICCPITSLR